MLARSWRIPTARSTEPGRRRDDRIPRERSSQTHPELAMPMATRRTRPLHPGRLHSGDRCRLTENACGTRSRWKPSVRPVRWLPTGGVAVARMSRGRTILAHRTCLAYVARWSSGTAGAPILGQRTGSGRVMRGIGSWLGLAAVVVATAGAAEPAAAQSTEFSYTGGEQTYTVPAGVSSLSITAVGAPGGAETHCRRRVPPARPACRLAAVRSCRES